MSEIRPQFGRELKADDLKVGLRLVAVEPYPPGRSVIMTVVELTDTTVRLISMALPKMGQRLGSAELWRLRPDGYIEDWESTVIHVFEYLERPEQAKPITPPFLPSDSLRIGTQLMTDELKPDTMVVLYNPDALGRYCAMQVAQIDGQTVELLLTTDVSVRITLSVQPDKTLRNPMGNTVKVFEYLDQP